MAATSEPPTTLGPDVDLAPRRSLASGAVWVTSSRVVLIASSAGASVITARILGPTGTGEFALAITFFGFLSLFATLGIDFGVVWQITRRGWPVARAFATTQWVALVVGLAGAAVGFAVYDLTDGLGIAGPTATDMLPVFLALPFALSWILGAGVALAAERYELALGPPALQALSYLVGIAVLAPVFGLAGALAAVLVGHAFAAGALWLRGGDLRQGERGGAEIDDRRELAGAISFGSRPYAATILTMINYRIDILLLAAFVSKAEVGYYAVAVALTLPLSILAGSLGVVLFPRVATLREDSAGANDVVGKTLRHAILLIVGGGAAIAAALIWLVVPVFGARYAPVTEPGLILLPGAAALALFQVFSGAISGRGKPQAVLTAMLFTTPATIALYLILIPAYGINGAALASTVSYTASAMLLGLYFHRVDGGDILARLVPGRDELADYRALARRVRALAGRSH